VPPKQQAPLPLLWQQTLPLILPHPLLLAELSVGIMVSLPKVWAVVHNLACLCLNRTQTQDVQDAEGTHVAAELW